MEGVLPGFLLTGFEPLWDERDSVLVDTRTLKQACDVFDAA